MTEPIFLSLKSGERVPPPEGCVCALGFFDGLHIGHRHLLSRAGAEAEERHLPLLLFTFLPEEGPKGSVPLLTPPSDRAKLFREAGADLAVMAYFPDYREMTAEDFVEKILINACHVSLSVVGENFRFGKGAAGDAGRLYTLMKKGGREAIALPSVSLSGETVSASAIRRALSEGSLLRANAMLGAPFRLTGEVTEGQRLGRTFGFPTANITPPPHFPPMKRGVYRTEVTLEDGRVLCGVTNLGLRPTVKGEGLRAETHLLDFSGDLYGRRLTLSFLDFLREERAFPSKEELFAQIKEDCECVRLWNKRNGSS